ncbi:ankyrin repeat domain-containing protein [Chitinophaga agrisoli]|uniref:Ankyrin repeat domain-containing protein n=1 Tax=Chitinophaga agrisoli TaxID=2607653 RepID=A0A5B2W050_9BACT|nr:ankyrin repeat domain-containing protein [Chitinophaga agrisoli]KAA2243777.1 ankyrin repeat domain-containing protein [Chitinophaga agrisoli]
MEAIEITDPLFREAVTAIDTGNVTALENLLAQHPELVTRRLDKPEQGYFQRPFLLWFIADNPIRNGRVPSNITDITQVLIAAIQKHAPDTLSMQLTEALGLVVTGSSTRGSGVQIALIDQLIAAGATPNGVLSALAHNNTAAAQQLLERGVPLTLPAAVGLQLTDSVNQLLPTASKEDRQLALVLAAFYGNATFLSLLISPDIDINATPDTATGFHRHATALHQAVSAACPECVQLLLAAGADTGIKDHIYRGTPLDWAEHLLTADDYPADAKERLAQIAGYLRNKYSTC